MFPARRMKTGVLETIPAGLVGSTTEEVTQLLLFEAEICQPGGGVTVKAVVRFDPLTAIC